MLQQSGALQKHTTDTFLFISHTMNVILFKFLCNIFTGVTIIKEMPGSVASGTPYIMRNSVICAVHLMFLTFIFLSFNSVFGFTVLNFSAAAL
jgi:hypothetical protein